jgi:hypothetical protein
MNAEIAGTLALIVVHEVERRAPPTFEKLISDFAG